LFGSLLFAAHPVHVEAVTWLAARKEVLQGFFFFSAFYLYLKGRETEGRERLIIWGSSLFAIILAALSKPSAVVFPGVIILYEIAIGRQKVIDYFRRHWIFVIILVLVSGVFIFILMKVMIEAGGIRPFRGNSFMTNALIPLYAFFHNIILLVGTVNYSAAYSFEISLPVFCLKNIVLIFITGFMFSMSLISLRWTKVIFFPFFFFFIALLPYLNIIPISTLLADRYVFIASFAYAFLLGILFDRFYAYRQKRFSEGFFKLLSVSIFSLLLMGYSYMTVRQNTIWENSYTLWADAVEKHPNSNTANALMGVVYMELGMDEEAQKYLEKAIQLLPYDYQSRNNLGIVYGKLNLPEKALKELAIAMELDPDNDNVKINLAILFLRQKEYEKAEEIYKYLIDKNPRDSQLHFRLSFVYKEAGRYEKAISELEKASELAPNIINPYEEMGNIYASRLMDRERAVSCYSRGMEAAPRAKSRVEDLRWMVQDLQR
jgi:tetratricopeptide (TPR) repeat protein